MFCSNREVNSFCRHWVSDSTVDRGSCSVQEGRGGEGKGGDRRGGEGKGGEVRGGEESGKEERSEGMGDRADSKNKR